MKEQELISVVVTSYNHAEYLGQRMESLLHQSWPNLEVVVVDDCSTDNSAEVLAKYQGIPNVRIVLQEKNRGYADTSNLGVSLARGRYVLFAECDDYSEPDQVQALYQAITESNSTVVAFSRSTMVDESGKATGDDFAFREERFKRLCASDALISAETMRNFLMFSCVIPNMSAAMFKKKSFERIGGLSQRYRACADWDFWCRMAEEGDFRYLDRPLNNFRSHSTTVRNTFNTGLQIKEIYEIVFRVYRRCNLKLMDRLRFKYNIGVIWASYLANPVSWLASLPQVFILTLRYEPLAVLFMLYAAAEKVCRRFFRRTVTGNG